MLPSYPRLQWAQAGTIKIVGDGNSLLSAGQDGAESVGGLPGYVQRNVSPFTSQYYTDVAIGGQNTDAMTASPSDVDGAFDGSKKCILWVQELTNQVSTADSAATVCQKILDYIAARRAVHPWHGVVVTTAPPVYLGDQQTQAETNDWNAKLDASIVLLRQRYREEADVLFDIRQPGTPFTAARYPDYLKSRFYETTVIDGISNTASLITEPSGGAVPNGKIHMTAACFAVLAPYAVVALRQLHHRSSA